VAKGALQEVPDRPLVVMPLGVAENATKLRLIYDAQYLNLFCKSPDMRYESLRQFQRGIGPADEMFSLDHKSGYHHIPLTEASSRYVGVHWGGRYYVWRALPFGWAPACYVYNTMSTVVAAYLRRQGVHCLVYLDDFGFSLRGGEPDKRRRLVWLVMAVMYLAGYVVSRSKSHLVPGTRMQLLGFILDSILEQFEIPEAKLAAILQALRATRRLPSVRLIHMQSVVGKVQALSLAVPCVAVYLSSAYREMGKAVKAGDNRVTITPEIRHDFQDLEQLQSWTRMSRWRREEHMSVRLDTDASGKAWGGCLWSADGEFTARGRFTEKQLAEPIHVKEAWAVAFSLKQLGDHVRDCIVDLYTDNEVVRFTIMKGGTDYSEMRKVARYLVKWQLRQNTFIRIHRVSTGDNVVADELSRSGESSPAEQLQQRLQPGKFVLLQSWYATRFTVDACAAVGNTQLPRFVARTGPIGGGQIAANAFMYRFPNVEGQEFLYCYPPWALVSPLWRHFQLSGCWGVMLLPDDPLQPWYGTAMQHGVVGILANKGAWDAIMVQDAHGHLTPIQLKCDLLAVTFDFRKTDTAL